MDTPQVPEMPAGYRAPCPPKWKKGSLNLAAMVELEEKASQVTISANSTLEGLVSELTNGLNNDVEKVRALFIWMGNQDFEEQSYNDNLDAASLMACMKYVQQRRLSYAEFFALLCRSANLQCVVIHGYCKGTAYDIGEQDVSRLRSSWNAVLLHGSWQIVHPYWAFVSVDGHNTGRWTKIESEGRTTLQKAKIETGVHVRDVDDFFFLPSPEEFIYVCYAQVKAWQLLKQPWTLHKFCNVPNFRIEYFASGYDLISDHRAILTSIAGKCEVEMRQHNDVNCNLSYELFFDEEQSDEQLPPEIELSRTVFYETVGNRLRLLIRFHVIGIYKLSLSAAGMELMEFRLDATEKSSNERMIPANPQIGYGFGHTAIKNGLVAPSHQEGVVVSRRNTDEIFHFKMEVVCHLVVRLRHNRVDSTTLSQYIKKVTKGKSVSVKVQMPDDPNYEEYALQLYKEEEKEENNILNYLLTNRRKDFQTMEQMQRTLAARKQIRENKIRRNLSAAQGHCNMDMLERCTRAFEKANLKDTLGHYHRAKELLGYLKRDQKEMEVVVKLKQKLRKAIQARSMDTLKKAIAKAEESDSPEVQELVNKAKDLVLEIEIEEMREEKEASLRRIMVDAIQSREMIELEQTIYAYLQEGYSDSEELDKARETLCQLYEEGALDAMSTNDMGQLQEILNQIERSAVSEELLDSEIMDRAQKHWTQQRRLKRIAQPALTMTPSTVAEIKAYTNPKTVTKDIMRSVFTLLGEHPKEIECWSKIQKFLKPCTEVVKKIERIKPENLHDHTVKRANQLIDKYSIDDVSEVSPGVAAFYEWSNNMIQAKSRKDT